MPDLTTQCPACGHHTSAAVGGHCTVPVPGAPGGPLVGYCNCNCYRALTGRDLFEEIAALLWPGGGTSEGEEGGTSDV